MMLFAKKYNKEPSRAAFILKTYREYLKGTVLDIGSGGSPAYLRPVLGDNYKALDVADSRCKPDIYVNFEQEKLPLKDGEFSTVISMDCIEHCENIHDLFDEIYRVANKYVIISLPNNWPGFHLSFIKGHNVSHQLGYGLRSEPLGPGVRHKWFFNLEEAEEFLVNRTRKNGGKVLSVDYFYEPDDFLINFPGYSMLKKVQPYHINRVFDGEDTDHMKKFHRFYPIMRKLGRKNSLLALTLVKLFYVLPLSFIDEVLKRLIWGWGSKFRYLNMFCQQIWIVIEKKPKS